VSVVFRLKPGKKAAALYRALVKRHLKAILVTFTFTGADGVKRAETATIRLKH
jgi:hypothetical protein